MKKKLLTVIVIIIIIINFTSCSFKFSPFNEDNKPSKNYYTQELLKLIKVEQPKKVSMFYREFFEEFTFPNAETSDIISFLESLKEDYYIEKPSDLPETYDYKVYLNFNNKKYAMTIFNEKYASIYEWDGDYEVDYINMTDIPLSLNIYGICKYFIED